jgi:hypothetical protein
MLRMRFYLIRSQLTWALGGCLDLLSPEGCLSWFGRVSALAIGIGLWWIGISFAADVGEILVGTPLLFIGTVAVAFAVTGRRPPRLRRSRRPEELARTPDQLRAQVSTLETEVAASTRALADLAAGAAAAEARAMEAIQLSDDRAARTALLEHRAFAEKAAAVAADLSVLRAILDECHEFESRLSESRSPRQ